MDQKPPQQPFSPHELTGQPANCPWAYFSLLFGLLSPVVLCFCGLSLLTSIIAIVTGHVSLARIRNSYGELQGVGLAITGLIFGYAMLVISIVGIVLVISLPEIAGVYHRHGQARNHSIAPPRTTATPPPAFRGSENPRGNRRTSFDEVPVAKDVVQEFPNLGWAVHSLEFSPAGDRLAVGKVDRTVLILDIASGASLAKIEDLHDLSAVEQIAFAADGEMVIAAGSSGAVVGWSIDSAGLLADAMRLERHAHGVTCLAAQRTSPYFITGASDGELLWQSLDAGQPAIRQRITLQRGPLAVHLPREGTEALVTDGGTLIRVNLETSKVISTREFPRSAVQSAAFSPDGRKLAITAGYQITIYSTDAGETLSSFTADHEMQWTVAFLPDGERMVSGGRGFATLWDLQSETAAWRFDLGGILYVQTLAISPDGRRLAAIPAAAGQTLSVLRIPE